MAEKAVLVSLAGPAAEMTYRGEPYHPGFVGEWAQDWRDAWEAATGLVASEALRVRYLEQQTSQLCELLDEENHWAAVAEIADQLLAHDRLEAEEVAACVSQWIRR